MSDVLSFSAQTRDTSHKPAWLRANNQLPVVVHMAGESSLHATITFDTFKQIDEQIGETGVCYLQVGSQSSPVPVMISETQWSPLGDQVYHVTFKKVDLTQKVVVEIPIELVGENNIPDSVVSLVQDTVEMEALPTDLPEFIEVDISQLTEIDQAVTLRDLAFDTSKISLVADEEDLDQPVVLLQAVAQEKEEEVAETETTKSGDGEEPAPQKTDGGESGKKEG